MLIDGDDELMLYMPKLVVPPVAVVGRMLFVVSRHDGGDFWSVWTAFVYFSLGLSLILIGLATWHFLRFGVGTLVATGLLAVVALLFTLNDFVDGDPVWSR
ncbi:MAG: hypothetical protein ACI9OJ_004667, partial [Myxococcota bacterium]